MSQPPDPEPTAAAFLRVARRQADLSQRDLARRAGVSASIVGRIEGGERDPSLRVLNRLLAACGLQLVLADQHGHAVPVGDPSDGPRDSGGRRFPAHLDLRQVIAPGDWWHDKWCTHARCDAPQWTFDRDRDNRDRRRAEPRPASVAGQVSARLARAGRGRWRLIVTPDAARALATFGDIVELQTGEKLTIAGIVRKARRWYAQADLPRSVHGQSVVLRARRGASGGGAAAY